MTLIINPSTFPQGETNFLIDGPAGHLELLTLTTQNPPKGVAIICHPHPLHDGTMHNKVVHTLSRAFYHKDILSIRFNYRGVGKSEGEYGDSIGEIADLEAVIAWSNTVLAKPALWLAGFSFGSYIAANAANRHDCQQLFTIAPAIPNQPYDKLLPPSCPWIVVQGEEDEVIAPDIVYAWYEKAKLNQNITLFKFPQTSHFFHGKLVPLRKLVEDNIVGV